MVCGTQNTFFWVTMFSANDAKLTELAGWTDNQHSEIIDIFEKNKTITEIRFRVKSGKPDMKGGLKQGDYIIIKRENVFKTIYNGNGTDVRTLLDQNKFIEIEKNTITKPIFR